MMGSTNDIGWLGPHGKPSLPMEVWGEITNCLSVRDAIALSRVNRLFYSAFIDDVYHRYIKYARNGHDVLIQAVTRDEMVTAQRALDQGADPNAVVCDSLRIPIVPLLIATLRNDEKMVKLLLDYGADPLYVCDKHTAIGAAVVHNRIQVLELLLAAENLQDTSSSGITKPPRALGQISRHANCRDSQGWTMLHLAAMRGFSEAVRTLIRFGARVDARDISGELPLHLAINKRDLRTVELLLDAGADPRLREYDRNNDALDFAVLELIYEGTDDNYSEHDTYHGRAERVMARIATEIYGERFPGSWYGVDEARIHHWLVSFESCEDVEELCRLSKKVDAISREGVTPLWVMCGGDPAKHEIDTWVKTLLDCGADINFKAPCSGMTPLMRAVEAKNLKLMIIFHEHGGCDVLAKDNGGNTALDWARRVGFLECAKMLEKCVAQAIMKKAAM